MRTSRLVGKSVVYTLEHLFDDQSVLGRRYNIYGEQDLRVGTTPTFPYLYLLDFGVDFQTEHLPVIVVQPSVSLVSAQMGTSDFHVSLALHVFGRDRGQRYDLSAAIMESVDAITLVDASGSVVASAGLLGESETGRLWFEQWHVVGEEVAMEKSLAHWVTLVTSFLATYGD